MGNKKNAIVWQASREYAGIAEAGGVKNVACSLSEGLVKQGIAVTLFIPRYGCTMTQKLSDTRVENIKALIPCGDAEYTVTYSSACLNGVSIIFVNHPVFAEKRAVYTYTSADEKANPLHVRGTGHTDADILNVLFQKSVVAYAQLTHTHPDVLHCQDAHTALIPALVQHSVVAPAFKNTKFIVSIHNAGAGYHQSFFSLDHAFRLTGLPIELLRTALLGDTVEPFLLASPYAQLATVSPWYAAELCDPKNDFSGGLSRIFFDKKIHITGITNGIDYERYNPTDTSKSLLPYAFNPAVGDLAGKYRMREDFVKKHSQAAAIDAEQIEGIEQFGFIEQKANAVYFSYHGRMAQQKGLDILTQAAHLVLEKNNSACFIINGQGEARLEQSQIELARQYPGRYCYFRGYNQSFARQCVAVADFLVLPSFFEPCGLEDFIGQFFGTIPVAHGVGGLQKIINQKTGFLYYQNTPEVLVKLLLQLCAKKEQKPKAFDNLIMRSSKYVQSEYCWKKVIKSHYLPLYF